MRSNHSVLRTIALMAGAVAAFQLATAGTTADILVKEAWVRWIPAIAPGGAYFTLANIGTTEHTLTGASSPDFGEVTLHQSQTMNGLSQMRAVASLAVMPGSTVKFEPGSYHLMLTGPKHALNIGDQVSVTLRFADGQSVTTPFTVRASEAHQSKSKDDMGDMSGMDMSSMHH